MKCPNCGSENVNLISNTTNRGFRGSDACCGYMLMGPLGILCGSFGSGQKKTNEFWVCNSCGSRFQDKEIKKYNQKVQNNADYYEPDDGKTVPEPEFIDEPVEAPISIPLKQENKTKSVMPLSPKTTVARSSPYNGNLSADALLNRALIFLEDGDWEKAYEYSDNALDVDAGYAEAYLVKFMAEYNIFPEESIPQKCADMMSDIDSLSYFENYRKAQRFGDDEFEQKLENYSNQAIYLLARKTIANSDSLEKYKIAKAIYERIPDYSDASEKAEECEKKFFSKSYAKAEKLMGSAESENDFLHAKSEFERISDYMDSAEKAEQCYKLAKEYHKEYIYNRAKYEQDNDNIHDLEGAIAKFSQVSGYKDADERIQKCRERIKELKEIKEKERAEMKKRQQEEEARQAEITKRNYKIAAIAAVGIIVLIIIICIISGIVKGNKEKAATYNQGIAFIQNGSYDDAIKIFEGLGSYKDSKKQIKQANYSRAISLIENGLYSEGITILEELGDFEGASEKLAQIDAEKDEIYKSAQEALDQGLYDEAIISFQKYGDMTGGDKTEILNSGNDCLEKGSYLDAIIKFATLGSSYPDGESLVMYSKGLFLFENGSNKEAQRIFEGLGSFKDADKYAKYIDATSLAANKSYTTAKTKFEELGDFLDSKEQAQALDDIPKLGKYNNGIKYMQDGMYQKAIEEFSKIDDFKDSKDQIAIAKEFIREIVQNSSYIATVSVDGKYGYINEKGAYIINPMFDEARDFDGNELALVKVNGKYGYINIYGEYIIEPIFYNASSFEEDGYAGVKLSDDDDWQYINTLGEFVNAPNRTYTYPISTPSDYEANIDPITGYWGYTNKYGDFVIDPSFDYACSFSDNGLAVVYTNDKTGCINKKGEILFTLDCDIMEPFADNGLARIGYYRYGSTIFPDAWGFVDSTGNIVINPIYGSANDFTESGLACVSNCREFDYSKLKGYIDLKGNVVIDFQFDMAGDFQPIPKGSN